MKLRNGPRNMGRKLKKNFILYSKEIATDFPNGWTRKDALAAKYAPATSAEVERTFSKLKYLLSDRRLTMTVQTLSSYLIVYNNYKNY
jgi:hypothetical protein